MRLWTYQTPDFDIFSGSEQVDHARSEFASTVEAYLSGIEDLVELLGTDQFLWAEKHARPWNGRVEYELEVPSESMLGVLDGFLWNLRIDQRKVPPPERMEKQWSDEAAKLYPSDGYARRHYEKTKRREYQMRPLPERWLAKALRLGPTSEDPQYLLPFPVPRGWHVSSQ